MGGSTKFFFRTQSMGPTASNPGDGSPKESYRRLGRSLSSCCAGELQAAPKGYVPVLVGTSEDVVEAERVLVPVGVLKEPSMLPLLDMAAREFGYCQEGILRIPCDAECFRIMVSELSKPR